MSANYVQENLELLPLYQREITGFVMDVFSVGCRPTRRQILVGVDPFFREMLGPDRRAQELVLSRLLTRSSTWDLDDTTKPLLLVDGKYYQPHPASPFYGVASSGTDHWRSRYEREATRRTEAERLLDTVRNLVCKEK